jgi:hypothetical protein
LLPTNTAAEINRGVTTAATMTTIDDRPKSVRQIDPLGTQLRLIESGRRYL